MKEGRQHALPFIFSGCGFLLAASGIMWLAKHNPSWSESLRSWGQSCASLLGKLFSFTSLPLSEWLVLLIPCALLALLIYCCITGGLWGLFCGAARVFSTLCVFVFLFVFLYGTQYTAPSLASRLDIEVSEYSVEQLEATAQKMADKMNELAPKVGRNADGDCDFGSFDNQVERVASAYKIIYRKWDVFSSPVLPKRTRIISVAMSYFNIAGFYFPFTGEPTVSSDNVGSHTAFCAAHEAAHSMGIGPESEANFSAYLCCTLSGDSELAYSAYFNAYIYANNALYAVSPEKAQQVANSLGELCRHDISALNTHWDKYDTRLREVGDKVNDSFIKSTGQPSGVQSYGEMVDLLIAWESRPEAE